MGEKDFDVVALDLRRRYKEDLDVTAERSGTRVTLTEAVTGVTRTLDVATADPDEEFDAFDGEVVRALDRLLRDAASERLGDSRMVGLAAAIVLDELADVVGYQTAEALRRVFPPRYDSEPS